MESDKLYFASTHFYFKVKEDDSVEISVQGNLYNKGGDVHYSETSEFENQLKGYLKGFKYTKVNEEDVLQDELYMEAMEKATKVKGCALLGKEMHPFYGYYILKQQQTKIQMSTIVDYITLEEYLTMVEFDSSATYLKRSYQ